MNEVLINRYLAHLGMAPGYKASMIPCEICGETSHTVIRANVDIGRGGFGWLPVVSCDRCGFLYQNPRFEKQFYDDYYSSRYRNTVYGKSEPEPSFIEDQIERGRILFGNIKKELAGPGKMLDVGCSSGGMMLEFMKNGWSCLGTDPDSAYVKYGVEKLKLPVIEAGAENMALKEEAYDFIMIMGSLEHVYDPNLTLALCRKASKKGALLLLEGRGHPQGSSRKYFNHNHQRYLSTTSMELFMLKFGWSPLWSTDKPLSGASRPGSIYCMGKAGQIPSREVFLKTIDSGKKENPRDILKRFGELDRLHGEGPVA